METGLRLMLLGKPQVIRDAQAVSGLIYSKALALLAYLAVTKRPHSREVLAGLLWGEMSDSAAKANLRKILSVLREAAGRELTIDRHTVAFNTECVYWLDTEVFESKLRSLPAASYAVTDLSVKQIGLLEDAVKLYSGDFLEGFYVHNAPAFEEWVLPEREQLRQMVMQALYRLGAYYTAKAEYTRALDYVSRLLTMEPWQEEVHQQMMTILALSGQRSAAVRQYQMCRELLARELGVEPNADTIALYKRIQSGELGQQPIFAASAHVLPSEATPFVGRQEELATLLKNVTHPDCRLVTVAGLSGVGKTRLALQAATSAMPMFRHGVCFVPLAQVDSDKLFYLALAQTLGLAQDRQQPPRARVLAHLREQEILLVLDQCEHLGDDACLLADLVQQTARVKLLVTSLERLNLRGEWVMPLDGFRVPKFGSYEELVESDAIRLFVEGARRVQPGFALSSANLPHALHICEMVEGMPLGIELAAAWTRILTCREIADELEQDLGFLTSATGDVPERHRSLQLALTQSWNRLSETEKDLFRKLCVFAGGFTRDAAQQVADASLPLLVSLADKGLVKSSPFGRHYIHPLLRRFGQEKLADAPEVEVETRDRHSRHYLVFLRGMMGRFSGLWQEDALAEIVAEQENLRAAWRWASTHDAQS